MLFRYIKLYSIEIFFTIGNFGESQTRRNGGSVAKVGEVELEEIVSQLIYTVKCIV